MRRALSQRNGPAAYLLARCVLLLFAVMPLLSSCTTASTPRAYGMTEIAAEVVSLPGQSFTLHAVERTGNGNHAHVFIEGDGRPWRAGGRIISDDPTPRHTPMLDWMLRVPAPALYLGRPCYFQQPTQDCHPLLWTYARYSETVVTSMHSALLHWLEEHPHIEELTLTGHSGGGILALLLAERIPEVRNVLTIAAPVDVDAWSDLHGYGRLFGSINPAAQTAWRPDVTRLLLYGQKDSQVPAAVFAPAAGKIPGAKVRVVKRAEHGCCADYESALLDAMRSPAVKPDQAARP